MSRTHPAPSDRGQIVVDDNVLAAGFTQIPNPILESPDLSIGAKLTYAMLLRLHWSNRGYPGHHETAALLGCARASLCRYLTELTDAHLITSERLSYGSTNTYHILDWHQATLQLTVQRCSPDSGPKQSSPETPAVQPLDENVVKALDSDSDSESETDSKLKGAVERLTALAPEENARSLLTYLRGYPIDRVQSAVAATEAQSAAQDIRRPVAYCYAALKAGERVRQHRQRQAAALLEKSAPQRNRELLELAVSLGRSAVEDGFTLDMVRGILRDSFSFKGAAHIVDPALRLLTDDLSIAGAVPPA